MKYTIYHVPGVKIGCTDEYPDRCYKQGFKDGQFEPLAELEFAKKTNESNQIAGDLERDYQASYGFKYDRRHYADSIRYRAMGNATGLTGFASIPYERRKELGVGFENNEKNKENLRSPEYRKEHKIGFEHIEEFSDPEYRQARKIGFENNSNPTLIQLVGASAGGTISSSRTRECPYCGFIGKMPSIFVHIKSHKK